jgi:hypothetical protein
MSDTKVYILIEDKKNKTEARIDGDLQVLRGLLYSLQADPPAHDISPADYSALLAVMKEDVTLSP